MTRTKLRRIIGVGAAIGLAALVAWGSSGARTAGTGAEGLPRTFGWTAYGTTSGGYAVSVAIGNALVNDGYRLRVIPAKNDISRMTPLRAGRVHFAATGIGSYLSQEGVRDFATRRWGPQPVRIVMMSWSNAIIGLPVTTQDAGIESPHDFAGKRVAWVVGAPALNENMTAWLAYGGHSWDDVVRVDASGWKASIQGMIDGTIDVAIASTNSSMLFQLEGSPRGLKFLPAPHDDAESWARLRSHAPWFAPFVASAGVGLSAENTLEGASYGYPILTTYADHGADMAYDMARLMHERFDAYKDAHSIGLGFAIDRQVFDWIVPYHAGAVRYFREIGAWTEAHEAHNQALIARQRVLAFAWRQATEADVDEAAFVDHWLATRERVLMDAGLDPIWRN